MYNYLDMVLTRKIAQELFEPFNLKLIQLRTKTSHGLNKLRQLKITIIIHWRRQRRRFGLPILLNYEAKKNHISEPTARAKVLFICYANSH